jgi:asparagine synthase (glutamine-hydrolysing)
MCGIAGYLGEFRPGVVETMTRRLTHRGPDAEGYHYLEKAGLALGHRRLSIVDLTDGAQPMHLPEAGLTVVFNGEIYNHAELRRELEARGHRFFTDHSDTEVLLHGYREWGELLPEKLQGMWAFALRDEKNRRLFCSRDRFGKKPFFYFQRGGEFAFASELTGLLEHPSAPRELSALARVKFLAYALMPSPFTPIVDIWQLPPGSNLRLEDGGELKVWRYWEYILDPVEGRGVEELSEELLAVLRGAVRRRLVADVPLGIFLSGGIDSSTVAALAAEVVGGENLQTFTIGFTEPSFDESEPARQMATALGSQHHEQTLDLEGCLSNLPEIFALLDQPQGDASLLPTWLLCRFARQRVTVALGGDGGDELFAGYDPFRALHAAEQYARWVPRPLHEGLRLLASAWPAAHANMSLDFKIKRTLRGLLYPSALWNPVWLGALEPAELGRVTGTNFSVEEIYSEAIAAWESVPGGTNVERTLQFFTRLYLADGILPKADRASMMNSLEVRSPFLDFEVAEFARRLPERYKFNLGETKVLLKRAVGGIVPENLLRRKKKGFGMPVGAWLRTGKLRPPSLPVGGEIYQRRHLAGRADERLYLWCELVWQEWQKRHLPVGLKS